MITISFKLTKGHILAGKAIRAVAERLEDLATDLDNAECVKDCEVVKDGVHQGYADLSNLDDRLYAINQAVREECRINKRINTIISPPKSDDDDC